MEQEAVNVNSQLRQFLQTSKGKSYTIVVITGLLILVLISFAVLPAVNSILLQLRQNEDRLAALEKIDEKRETLGSLLARQEASEEIAVALNRSLPFELDQEVIFDDLVQFIEQSGTKFKTIRFVDAGRRSAIKNKITDNNVIYVQSKIVNMIVDGERENLKEFIRLLEQDRRIYNLTNLSISKVRSTVEGDNAGPYRLNIQAEVYYWDVNAIF